jgi:hypothetical protein
VARVASYRQGNAEVAQLDRVVVAGDQNVGAFLKRGQCFGQFKKLNIVGIVQKEEIKMCYK